jgi:hypothetical protein
VKDHLWEFKSGEKMRINQSNDTGKYVTLQMNKNFISGRNEKDIIKINPEVFMMNRKYEHELNAYEDIMIKLCGIKGLNINTRSPKVSMAFLIEEIKKGNPEGWQQDIDNLKDEIREIDRKEGASGVSYFLAERINNSYISFLKNRRDEHNNHEVKEKIDMIILMAEENMDFITKLYNDGEMVSFGGVSLSYVPEWYYFADM